MKDVSSIDAQDAAHIGTRAAAHRVRADIYDAVQLLYSRRLLELAEAQRIVTQLQVEHALRFVEPDRDFIVDDYKDQQERVARRKCPRGLNCGPCQYCLSSLGHEKTPCHHKCDKHEGLDWPRPKKRSGKP